MAVCEKCKPYGIVCSESKLNKTLGKLPVLGDFVGIRTAAIDGVNFPVNTPINECPVVTGESTPKEFSGILKERTEKSPFETTDNFLG